MELLVRLAYGGNREPPKRATFGFAEGARRCGDDVTAVHSSTYHTMPIEELLKYDLIVTWNLWGIRNLPKIRRAGVDFLVLELGYVGNRSEWFSVGYNDLNGRAERVVGIEPRRKKIWNEGILKPWSMEYDHALLIGQVERDMTMRDCKDVPEWYQTMTDRCLGRGLPVVFREHPLGKPGYCPENATVDRNDSLQDAMRGALVVTYSSNVGVDATLAGRPTIAVSPVSMVYGWVGRDLDEVGKFDREPWLHQLAYCQWHLDELRDGTAWGHYRKRFTEGVMWDTIRHRRSCRSFTFDPVPKELLWKIMEAGMWAPSGANRQNVRFLLIDDKRKIGRLGKDKTPHKMIGAAAACVVMFSANMENIDYRKEEQYIWNGLSVQNCAAAIQNMLLAATDLGVGSCWISFLDSMDGTRLLEGKTWRELFKGYPIPPNHSVHGMVLLGWPKEKDGRWPAGDVSHGGRLVEGRTLNRFLIGKRDED